MSEISFTSVTFPNARRVVHSPIAASVHKSSSCRVSFRISASLHKMLKIQSGALLTPFINLEHRAILLLDNQRPTPISARKAYETSGSAFCVEFPRSDGFEVLFPRIMPSTGLIIKEASAGRLVVIVPHISP